MKKTILALACAVFTAACAAEPADEPSASSQDAIAVGVAPAWKAVTLVFHNVDADYVDEKGVKRHAKTTMPDARVSQAIRSALDWPATLWDWSGHGGHATMEVVSVLDPIRHVSIEGEGNGYWVALTDIAAALDVFAPKGRYDSVFVIWDPQAIHVCCGWGRGPGADTNNMTYAQLYPDSGTEGMIHEFLHGAGDFYRSHGLAVPDPHTNDRYGYFSADAKGSWSAWYRGLLGGRLLDEGKVVGYTANVWSHGTPRIWTNATTDVPIPKPALAKPDIETAWMQDDWAFFGWKPSPGTSHYTTSFIIKKPDGSNGEILQTYEASKTDQKPVFYRQVDRNEICAAARKSGVPLAQVHAWVQVVPDHDFSHSASRDVDGSFDCRN